MSPYIATADEISRYRVDAQVVAVNPVVQRIQSSQPLRRCTWERLPTQERHYPQRSERRVIERRAKRCRTVEAPQTVKKTTGYNVTLRYQGETFAKYSTHRPGKTMSVFIVVNPLTN